ncbi:MAG: DinB family protein [Chitinophagaceae bacterium]|nr:MAG: DinB family protein [Chitinophagaceae bacterium]
MTTSVPSSVQSDVSAKITVTSREFLDACRLFTHEEFNKVPFAGSWTPGQVAEHVYKSVSGMPSIMKGNVADTSRDPAAKVAELETIFLDFSTKLKSPDFILPSDKKHDQQEMINALSASFDQIIEIAETEDLSLTCLDFQFPNSGPLTRLELISFAHVHTKRHAHQLSKIKSALG